MSFNYESNIITSYITLYYLLALSASTQFLVNCQNTLLLQGHTLLQGQMTSLQSHVKMLLHFYD